MHVYGTVWKLEDARHELVVIEILDNCSSFKIIFHLICREWREKRKRVGAIFCSCYAICVAFWRLCRLAWSSMAWRAFARVIARALSHTRRRCYANTKRRVESEKSRDRASQFLTSDFNFSPIHLFEWSLKQEKKQQSTFHALTWELKKKLFLFKLSLACTRCYVVTFPLEMRALGLSILARLFNLFAAHTIFQHGNLLRLHLAATSDLRVRYRLQPSTPNNNPCTTQWLWREHDTRRKLKEKKIVKSTSPQQPSLSNGHA